MDYVSELNAINSKLAMLETLRVAIEDAIKTAGGTPGSTFLGLANDIYNINITSNKKTFVVVDTSFKSFNGFTGLQKRAEYLADCKLYIRNAIIARGVNIPSAAKFSEYPDYIKSITGTSVLPIISLVSVKGQVANKTDITVNTNKLATNNSYRYKITDTLPTLGSVISNWTFWNGSDEIEVADGKSICIAEVDTSNQVVQAGVVICDSKAKDKLYPELKITMEKGSKLYATKISDITSKLNSKNKFYYIQMNISSFYIDDKLPAGFVLWDENSEIELNKITKYDIITFVEVNESNLIQRFGTTYAVVRDYAGSLNVTSLSGAKEWGTKISVTPTKGSGNTYSFISGEHTFIEDEKIDINDYGYWDGKSEIVLDEYTEAITIIEINADNLVQRFGYTSVNKLAPSLKHIAISSIPTDNPYGCEITTNPSKTDGNNYFYTEMKSGFLEKNYHDYVSATTSYNSWDGESELFIENGTRICLVELDSNGLLEGVGYAYIESNVPIVQNLKMKSEYGTTTGSCHITIQVPKDDENNFYVYRAGNYVYAYDDIVDKSDWIRYDFDKDLINLEDGLLITVLEVDYKYKVKKIGLVNILARPLELFSLAISSWKSQKGGCSNFYITPMLTSGNKYKYQFTETIPQLHDDLTDWYDYTEGMDVPSENAVTICFAEVDSNNLALKAGLCLVSARDPDPVLGTLTIESIGGTMIGYTQITVEEPLTDGYEYVYKETSVLPEYHESVIDWIPWDGASELYITDGKVICIVEATSDKFAYKGGIVEVYSKK